MKIKIDNYCINTDSQGNVFITEEVKSQSGKLRENRVSGYYSNFNDALVSMFSNEVFSSDATSLAEAIATIQSVYNKCEELLKRRQTNES